MKTKLYLILLLFFGFQAIEAQVQKVETYLVGTKVTYYPNQCGNTIPEAQGKLSFCDSQNNLGVVETSYGLNYRGISQMAPNYYNTDEVFVTEAGVSIRKTDGSWDNIPEFTAPRTNPYGNSPQMREVIVNNQGYMFFYHGSNWGLHYLDLNTKTYSTVSYATSTGGSNGNFTHSFAYDEEGDVTYIMVQSGGNSGFKVYKFESNTLSFLGNLPVEVTGENSSSKLIFANDALYFGTTTGLYKLNKTSIALEASYVTDASAFISNVKDIAEDTAGNLWLANQNNNDGAIYKLNMSNEVITTFQLARNTTTNYSFNNLDIDNNGTVWATANNLSGFAELEPTENNPTWTVRSLDDIRDLGFNMTYSPLEVNKFNNKIYIMVTNNSSSSQDVNYEAIINDNGVWSGVSDDEPNNLSNKMLNRYYFAYPDANGVWWFNDNDGGIMSHISNTDEFKKQYSLGNSESFTLDYDGNPIINGGSPYTRMQKIYMPYVADLPSIGTNAITQFHKYKDQIWVFSNTTRKIFVFKHNQLIQTFNLDDTTYNTWYDFTPDIYGNAFFAKRLGGNELELRKFDTNTQTTTSYINSTYLGNIKQMIPLPNGNVAVICSSGIFLFDGTGLSAIGSSMYADLFNVATGISDLNGKIYLLSTSGKLIGIENPEAPTPIFSTIQVSGTSGLVPYNAFYGPTTLAIDANGAFWSHASIKWFKITTDNTVAQFLNEGITFGITGSVYVDVNENNQFDANEGYPNQKLTLKTSSGAIFELYTKPDGSYYFPYFEGLGTYEIILPVLSPYVVAPERQHILNVANLDADTNVNDIKLQPKDIESLLVKSSSKQGAWGFTRSNFENTFTTAIGNISFSKTFNNVTMDYVFFNKTAGSNNSLPAVENVKVSRLQPVQPFHIIHKLTIEPRSHKWNTNVNPDSYTSTILSLTPTITTLTDTTKVSFTLPVISPLDTYILEVETQLFTPSSNGTVISYGVAKTSSEDYGDGVPEMNVVELIPRNPVDGQGFPELSGPFSTPEEIYGEPPYRPRKDVYADGPYDTPIRSSYDPNDKLVNPGVPDALNEIPLNEKWLTYTIRFQNEGNFSAKDVIVVDSLDQKFDRYSLTMLESSHPLTIETLKSNEQNIVIFSFNDIYLDYTANDEVASQGYLKYIIKAKEDVELNDIMENRAAIYFDQNPPIITNLTQNKYVQVTLNVEAFRNEGKAIKLWPNPVDRFVTITTKQKAFFKVNVYNLLGQKLQSNLNFQEEHQLDVSQLKSGIYVLESILQNGKTQTIKFIKN
ncbi:DUF7619 domain-containing protein [Subsaximicrobium wynnwilliamsii]|nr:T9SS type A sorting domain-containing protein [Subsaximicrobium wynnwilliamsii]